jgi:hypothetical protein
MPPAGLVVMGGLVEMTVDLFAGFPPGRGDVNDWSKLDIRDGVIYYRIYQQDGSMRPMTAPDTMHNRQCVSWIQIHDRM